VDMRSTRRAIPPRDSRTGRVVPQRGESHRRKESVEQPAMLSTPGGVGTTSPTGRNQDRLHSCGVTFRVGPS
jgi:hypothetical protein